MPTTKIKREDLLAVLKTNRDQHEAVFLEAQIGYRRKVIEVLEARLADARNDRPINTFIQLTAPVNQTKDYDRVIKMIEMGIDEVIELDEEEFSQYVLDQWQWQKSFAASNKLYANSVGATAYLSKIENS